MEALAKAIELAVQTWARIEDRKLDLLQQQLDITKKPIPDSPDVPMPHDVWMFCNKDSEKWAREDAMKLAKETYNELGNWDSVRERLGSVRSE